MSSRSQASTNAVSSARITAPIADGQRARDGPAGRPTRGNTEQQDEGRKGRRSRVCVRMA